MIFFPKYFFTKNFVNQQHRHKEICFILIKDLDKHKILTLLSETGLDHSLTFRNV